MKGRKGKSKPRRARKGHSHNPNMKQRREGVKKEQVKGCGSVNRPTPSSQRPAEPVATGFLEGVKISKNRGQILGIGVKLWVVDAGFSQRRAIPYGVKIGVAAISCFQQGKQSARLSAVHFVRGRAPDSPSFFSAPAQPGHLKICGGETKNRAPPSGRCKTTKRRGDFSPPRSQPWVGHYRAL